MERARRHQRRIVRRVRAGADRVARHRVAVPAALDVAADKVGVVAGHDRRAVRNARAGSDRAPRVGGVGVERHAVVVRVARRRADVAAHDDDAVAADRRVHVAATSWRVARERGPAVGGHVIAKRRAAVRARADLAAVHDDDVGAVDQAVGRVQDACLRQRRRYCPRLCRRVVNLGAGQVRRPAARAADNEDVAVLQERRRVLRTRVRQRAGRRPGVGHRVVQVRA